MASIFDRIADRANRLRHAYNVFVGEDDREETRGFNQYGVGYSTRPDRKRSTTSNDRSIVSSIYNRLGVDTASVDIRHVKVDGNNRYKEDVKSGLNNCLTVEANIDQAATAFKQDIAQTLFEKGVVALVPVDTSMDPNATGSYDIETLRAGEIVEWKTRHVRVKLWNDKTGKFQEIIVAKSNTAIIENPFYSVMNEPNSTLQRLIRKLNILDAVDEASGSGKLDLIIQLPYVIKSQARKEEAEKRTKDIEMQLRGSKYGIAYTDGTEHITQLNRPAENNLLAQITYLTGMVYSQLGLSEGVFNGSASEAEMLNYQNRTIAPILTAILEAMIRSFLTKTARTQGHTIMYFRDPFKLTATKDIAEIADKFMRNEVVTANEVRGFLGMKPSTEAKADQLRNANMPQQDGLAPGGGGPIDTTEQDDLVNATFDNLEGKINSIVGGIGKSSGSA